MVRAREKPALAAASLALLIALMVNAILPIEIVECILDHLANSKPDLSICALVCRSWTHRSRALLFHSLSTCPPSPSHLSEPFLKSILLAQSSHLADLVREVKVDCCHVSELTRITFNSLRLDRLTRLWLCRNDFARFDWDICLTRTLASSLETLILDRAVFKDAVQLLHFLSSPCFSKLRSLSLTNISYLLRTNTITRDADWIIQRWKQTGSSRPPATPKITLEELDIGLIPDHNIYHILYDSRSPFRWNRLKRITFYRIWDNGLIQGFLNGTLPALECLEWESTEPAYHFASSGAFSGSIQNRTILPKIIELSAPFAFTSRDVIFFYNILHAIGNGGDHGLSTVTLVFPVDLDGLVYHKLSDTSLFILHGTDVIFKLASLPSVKSLHLVVPMSLYIEEQRKLDVKSFMKTHFGFYMNAGSISVVYRPAVSDREPFSRSS
ncbi:hypothetical protein FB446DRAFT_784035 [Lentinula raphanica]|nr:hypothetical protein FB446DRAFT_784035 [Lentinula raphanica]